MKMPGVAVLAVCLMVNAVPAAIAGDAALGHARELLARAPLVDGHNDLPEQIAELAQGDLGRYELRKRRAKGDTDIPRLREGLVSGQFWSVWIPSGLKQPARAQLEQIDITRRLIAAYPDVFLFATRAADVDRARREGKIASFLGMENGQALENSLGALRAYYDLGVRYMTLTHGRNTDWADSATDTPVHGGLTPFGREVVREMNRLGMLVDISHVSPQVMGQVLDISEAPVIFSHSSARALVDHPRNVPDDVLKRLASNGGVAMVTFIPEFVSAERAAWGKGMEKLIQGAKTGDEMARIEADYAKANGPAPPATLAQVADHVDHVARVAGHDHVGIGSDFYGGPMPQGLEDVSRFPELFAELIRRGWSDANLIKLAGGNVLRALSGAEDVASRIQKQRDPSVATIASQASADCSCRSAVGALASGISANYIGLHLGQVDRAAEEARARLAARAANTPLALCHEVLQEYAATFRDGHLFVAEQPKVSDAEAVDLAARAESINRDEASLRGYLKTNASGLDPIEGIWYSKDGQRFGVLRDQVKGRRDFVAFLLSGAPEGWKTGQVKAEFQGLGDGSYGVTLYDRKHFPRHPAVYLRNQRGGAALRREGALLHMPPTTWGREWPAPRPGSVAPNPVDPRRPTLMYPDEKSVLIAVPSHSPEYAGELARLVESARARLETASTLIIDMRGNEGGSAGTTNVLAPFLLSPLKPSALAPSTDDPGVLSSPANIAYFAAAESQGWVPKGLVARLKEQPGKVTPFYDAPQPITQPSSPPPAAFLDHPPRVAILVDGAVVSAAEAALLQARVFSKVTVFGQPTGGTIDYQSVNMIPSSECGGYGFTLGYPIMAGSMRLPEGGFNARGIPPDVTIPADILDPIAFILEHYRATGSSR